MSRAPIVPALARAALKKQRLYQCPGCWAFYLHTPPEIGLVECECGEKATQVDLRKPENWNFHGCGKPVVIPGNDAVCGAVSRQGNRCSREPGHFGCHEVYVDGDGRRWWGDVRDDLNDLASLLRRSTCAG